MRTTATTRKDISRYFKRGYEGLPLDLEIYVSTSKSAHDPSGCAEECLTLKARGTTRSRRPRPPRTRSEHASRSRSVDRGLGHLWRCTRAGVGTCSPWADSLVWIGLGFPVRCRKPELWALSSSGSNGLRLPCIIEAPRSSTSSAISCHTWCT